MIGSLLFAGAFGLLVYSLLLWWWFVVRGGK